ncbi:hypothetical protein ScPMuIL_013094 [Solemya velum]
MPNACNRFPRMPSIVWFHLHISTLVTQYRCSHVTPWADKLLPFLVLDEDACRHHTSKLLSAHLVIAAHSQRRQTMAGNSVVNPGIRSSKVSPSYLHANSTSHTWPFSAIAELIDNTYDPDCNASELWIDRHIRGDTVCMTFVDNGAGMTEEKLHKMLSFGYCEKVAVGTHHPIGHYGNGFKSGSMRLAKDAIVLTCHGDTMSVGFLSQTYLEAIQAETVLVPIVTWFASGKRKTDEHTEQNLAAITKYSVLKSEADILQELNMIKLNTSGTKIILFNLKRSQDDNLELDFESSSFDICNPETGIQDYSSINRVASQHRPEYMKSLREYCSILYLKPKMKIVLMTKRVKTKFICKCLSHTEKDVYRPTWLPKPVAITFGFTASNHSEEYGVMFYHKNRLIKAYEKVGYQKQTNDMGVGVVGVVEANFLEPIHNKQDFNRTSAYTAFLSAISNKLNDYWNEKTGGNKETEVHSELPDWLWAQCENCLKWRRLPTGTNFKQLPDKWYCHMNPDAAFNRCIIDEEPEDDDEALMQATYKKTFKKQQEFKKRQIKVEEKTVITNAQLLLANKKLKELSDDNAKQKQIIDSLAKRNKEYEELSMAAPPIIQQVYKASPNQRSPGGVDLVNRTPTANTPLNYRTPVSIRQTPGSTPPINPMKRRLNGAMSNGDMSKKICIKSEDGGIVAILPLGGTGGKENEKNPNEIQVVDLTDDMDETAEDDVKPNVEVLSQMINNSNNNEQMKRKSSQGQSRQASEQANTSAKDRELLRQKTNEVIQLTSTLAATTNKLESLQQNICKLLKIIVPDVDLGDSENIGEIVSELIRVNAGQT